MSVCNDHGYTIGWCPYCLRERVAELEAVIKKHDLCHDLHGKVGQAEFEEGCRRETVKEFGSCKWAERIAELEAELATLRTSQRAGWNAAYRAGWEQGSDNPYADVRDLPEGWTPEKGGE